MEENISHDMDWIRKNEKELIKEYSGKYILVKDEKIRSVSENKQEIIMRGIKRFGRDNFVLYYVIKDDLINRINKEAPSGI